MGKYNIIKYTRANTIEIRLKKGNTTSDTSLEI